VTSPAVVEFQTFTNCDEPTKLERGGDAGDLGSSKSVSLDCKGGSFGRGEGECGRWMGGLDGAGIGSLQLECSGAVGTGGSGRCQDDTAWAVLRSQITPARTSGKQRWSV
jgi:hypothetical protein